MGLSASQARLLTITARKSDCEFQSMRYSHDKIALSRSMADISSEYQNSLNQTKLVYDYYGNGDTTTPLTYGLMMTPSELNGHMPMLTTDASGKVVLNSQYAAAARAAGIPAEGLGALPSSTIRNKFLQGLADAGLISQECAKTCQGIEYSQAMGLGTTDMVTSVTKQMNIEELLNHYAEQGSANMYKYDWNYLQNALQLSGYKTELRNGPNSSDIGHGTNITMGDILRGDYQILCEVNDYSDGRGVTAARIQELDIWNWMFDEFENMLGIKGDAQISGALSYAEEMTKKLLNPADGYALNFEGKTKENKDHYWGGVVDSMNHTGTVRTDDMLNGWDIAGIVAGAVLGGATGFGIAAICTNLFSRKTEGKYATSDYIGITTCKNLKSSGNNRSDGVSIDVTNIALSYLTYFAQAMEGIGQSQYKVDNTNGNRTIMNSHLIDDQFKFDVVVDTGINTDQALISGFYDSLFNQICTRGWLENGNIDDKDYLQQMYQNGMLFLTTCTDDGYYYQGNYSTNTFIKEVTDEDAIAKAEAKYNTAKQKLNQKEQIIDLKMKNLDTEISSLTTEYDTIKSVISKNIEKSFKRYDV